jgi:hypothetical protein
LKEWDCYLDEFFDEFLSAIGFSWIKRKAICSASYRNIVKIHDDGIDVTTISLVTKESSLKFGKEAESDVLGSVFMITSRADGDVVVGAGYLKDDKNITLQTKRYVLKDKDEMIMELHSGGIVAKRYFKRGN